MMQRNEALERLQEIQRIAERTTLYTLLPGAPAIVGGLLSLAACAVGFFMLGSFDMADLRRLPIMTGVRFCLMWAVVGIVAIAFEIIWTTRAAKKLGIKPMGRPGKFSALSLMPSVLVALILTFEFLNNASANDLRYIVPVWMMCYGTGVYAAGLFSVRLPRLLGLCFLALGAAGLSFFSEYALILAAVSFGLAHIIFGILIIMKTRGGNSE